MIEIFSQFPEIILAYQFGSSVKQPSASHRDIDIAVLFQEGLSVERRFNLQIELGIRLSKVFHKETDLVVLNQSNPFIAYQVLKYGRLLYGDKTKAREFVVETLTRYFDYLPIHQFFVERLEKRLGVSPHGR